MIPIEFLYFLLGLFASIVGSIAGLGGGIIIKPVLDFLGHYDVATISILSIATVFSMATISLLKSLSTGIRVKGKVGLTLAVGSIVGGSSGNIIFHSLIATINDSTFVTTIQSGTLASLVLMIIILVKNQYRIATFTINNPLIIFSIGLILGLIASFLGIGGGPLNMAVLTLLFSMNTKNASINSIFIIFLSQLSSLLITAYNTSFSGFDLSMLVYIVAGGIIGGFIGSNIYVKLSVRKVEFYFYLTLLLIFFLNVYNMIINLLHL